MSSGLRERVQHDPAPLVTGEFAFSPADFREIAAAVKADAGIALDISKATLVYGRLAKRVRALGLTTFREYCDLVAGDAGERGRMLSALTTNTTRFFREPHHFEHLKQHVLPPLVAAARRGGRVRIWSAAASTGQEPYSIALTVLSLLPDATSLDIKILATDINPDVLAHGAHGVYEDSELADIPADMQRWVSPVSGAARKSSRISEEARALISFRELNLVGDWPMRRAFDVIFCRNVVIYFSKDTQAALWQRLVGQLTPSGTLYIGHSERVAGPAAAALVSEGITTYRRVGEVRR